MSERTDDEGIGISSAPRFVACPSLLLLLYFFPVSLPQLQRDVLETQPLTDPGRRQLSGILAPLMLAFCDICQAKSTRPSLYFIHVWSVTRRSIDTVPVLLISSRSAPLVGRTLILFLRLALAYTN